MCVFVNETTDSVLYTEVSLKSGSTENRLISDNSGQWNPFNHPPQMSHFKD